jgi:translation initiation factor 1 (eIF-1/SUI1)
MKELSLEDQTAKEEILQELIELMSGSMADRTKKKPVAAVTQIEVKAEPKSDLLSELKEKLSGESCEEIDEDEEEVDGSAILAKRLKSIAK